MNFLFYCKHCVFVVWFHEIANESCQLLFSDIILSVMERPAHYALRSADLMMNVNMLVV